MVAAAVLVLSLFVEWYSLSNSGVVRNDPGDFVCGGTSNANADTSCTAWETFPILRWLLIAAASAPFILAWIVIRGHALSWPRGEVTAIVGVTVFVLIAYNGFVDKPSANDLGVSLSFGYWLAILASLGIFISCALRAVESGGGARRKPPATF
jgi:hypothetical protein